MRPATHVGGVMVALAVLAPLLVSAANGCYLVTNKRIEIIPCNFDPTVIAERLAALGESPPPGPRDATPAQASRTLPSVQGRQPPQSGAAPARAQGTEAAARGAEQSAPHASAAPQPSATPQPPAAPQTVQPSPEPQPSSTPQTASRTGEAQQLLGASTTELRSLEAALASGSAGDADAVLARAAQAFTAASSPQGAASIATAQQALARGDLYAARLAIAAAIAAASRR
jgi:colicin import membrane protein